MRGVKFSLVVFMKLTSLKYCILSYVQEKTRAWPNLDVPRSNENTNFQYLPLI